MLTVCSFFVDRRADYPDAVDYVPLLKALDRSCSKVGFEHVVLTDYTTVPQVRAADMVTFATDLPRNLMRALTESQARWMEDAHANDCDTLFVGADCLVRRDFREHLPAADLSIILRPGHKKHRINNGFMFVPASSREKVAPLFRAIADDCGEVMCDDMVAMPLDFGLQERAGLAVNFLPMKIWNGGPKRLDDSADSAHVLHFRGRARKDLMLDWADRWNA